MSKKYILVVESVTKFGCVALFSDLFQKIDLNSGNESTKLSADLIGMISGLVKRNAINLSQIGLIVVLNGPGSFTGLRVGWATVKGIAAALKIPVVSVSILDALFEALLENSLQDSTRKCAFVSTGGGKVVYKFYESKEFVPASVAEFSANVVVDKTCKFITIDETLSILFEVKPVNVFVAKDLTTSAVIAMNAGKISDNTLNYFG